MRSRVKPSTPCKLSELEQYVLCLANEPPPSLCHLDPCTSTFWKQARALPDWKEELGRTSPQALVRCLLRARGGNDDDDCVIIENDRDEDDGEWKPSGEADDDDDDEVSEKVEAPSSNKKRAAELAPMVPPPAPLKLKIQRVSATPPPAAALRSTHAKLQELQQRASDTAQALSAAQAEEQQLRDKLAKLHADQTRKNQEAQAAHAEASRHQTAVHQPLLSWEGIWDVATHIMDGDAVAKQLAEHKRMSVSAHARECNAMRVAKRAATEHAIQLPQLEKQQTLIGAQQRALDAVQQELQAVSAACATSTERVRGKTWLEVLLSSSSN